MFTFRSLSEYVLLVDLFPFTLHSYNIIEPMYFFMFQEFLLTPLQFGIPNSRLRYYMLARLQEPNVKPTHSGVRNLMQNHYVSDKIWVSNIFMMIKMAELISYYLKVIGPHPTHFKS